MTFRFIAGLAYGFLLIGAGCHSEAGNRAGGQVGDYDSLPESCLNRGVPAGGHIDGAPAVGGLLPIPACTPSCAAATFHLEVPSGGDTYGVRSLMLDDGRTLVGRAYGGGAQPGDVLMQLLSAEGQEDATGSVSPCREGTGDVWLQDLVSDGRGGFVLLARCGPDSDSQLWLVRLDSQLAVTDIDNILWRSTVNRSSDSAAILNGAAYLLYSVYDDEYDQGITRAELFVRPNTEEEVVVTVTETQGELTLAPVAVEAGYVLVTIPKLTTFETGDEKSVVAVYDGAGTEVTRLEGRRDGTGDFDFEPVAAHIVGDELVLAGSSSSKVASPNSEGSTEIVVERRKLDGTLVKQGRVQPSRGLVLSDVVPIPGGSGKEGEARWMIVMSQEPGDMSAAEQASQPGVPRFTWLTADLEAMYFARTAADAVHEVIGPVKAGCDCGYRMAWSSAGTYHVARVNNLLQFSPDSLCDDGQECTSEASIDGVCTLWPETGCLAPDGCYSADSPQSDNPCRVCAEDAPCGFQWRPLADGAGCGNEGQCSAGRCICEGRWFVAKGSGAEMLSFGTAGERTDGHVAVVTGMTTPNQMLPARGALLWEVTETGEVAELGPTPEGWVYVISALAAMDATYVLTTGLYGGKYLRRMDSEGGAVWSVEAGFPYGYYVKAGPVGLMDLGGEQVLVYQVSVSAQELVAEFQIVSAGNGQMQGFMGYSGFPQLEGDVDLQEVNSAETRHPIPGMVLPDGRILLLAGLDQIPTDYTTALHHEFMVLADAKTQNTEFYVMPDETFDAASLLGESGFVTCRDLGITEWNLKGKKIGTHTLTTTELGDGIVAVSCRGLSQRPGGGIRVLLQVDKAGPNETHSQIMEFNPDWSLATTFPLPLVPEWSGLSTLADGGFLVRGTLEPGVVALLRADSQGRYRCW